MKRLIMTLAMTMTTMLSFSKTYVDAYSVKMVVSIPRVYNNTESNGYRKYQTQRIHGTLYLAYDGTDSTADIQFGSFTNLTHKTSSGRSISYEVFQDEYAIQRLSVIGNNCTKTFKKANCCFDVVLEPSYSISDVVNEDNSLYIRLTSINGKFKTLNSRKIVKSMSGRVAGTVGCACSDYGHVSPTRLIGFWGPRVDSVVDVAACEGRWSMTYLYSFTK